MDRAAAVWGQKPASIWTAPPKLISKPAAPVEVAPPKLISMPAAPVEVAQPLVEYMGKTCSVILHKPFATSKLGIVLAGMPDHAPTISELKDGCVEPVVSVGLLKVGQPLVAVNGQKVYGHKAATQMLKAAQGDVVLQVGVLDEQFHSSHAAKAQHSEPEPTAESIAPEASSVAFMVATAQAERVPRLPEAEPLPVLSPAAAATAPAAKKATRGRSKKDRTVACEAAVSATPATPLTASVTPTGAGAESELAASTASAAGDGTSCITAAPKIVDGGGDARVMTLMLHKQDANSKLGIVLTGGPGQPPMIKELKPDCIGADAGMLTPGMELLAINGEACLGHEIATRRLKAAQGDVVLKLRSPSIGEADVAAPPQLVSSGAPAASKVVASAGIVPTTAVCTSNVSTTATSKATPESAMEPAPAPTPVPVTGAPTSTLTPQVSQGAKTTSPWLCLEELEMDKDSFLEASSLPHASPGFAARDGAGPSPAALAAPATLSGSIPSSYCVFAYDGQPMVHARGPMPPFSVYESVEQLELQISTFNLDAHVDEVTTGSTTGMEFGLWLRPAASPSALSSSAEVHVLHTSLSTPAAICSGQVGTEASESRIDVSLGANFDLTRIEFFETKTRLRIIMPKKASGHPKSLRLQVQKVAGD